MMRDDGSERVCLQSCELFRGAPHAVDDGSVRCETLGNCTSDPTGSASHDHMFSRDVRERLSNIDASRGKTHLRKAEERSIE